jgi:dTDP-4-amino-4,6-dideoxy-D-galactose acyltransferase
MKLLGKEIVHLEWDTNFFGFKTAAVYDDGQEIKIGVILNQLQQEAYKLVYVFLQSDKQKIIEESLMHGGFLADNKLTYQKSIEKSDFPELDHILEYQSSTIDPQLKKLAMSAGSFSRFRIDEKMPPGKFEQLYTSWLQNSVNGNIADKIWVCSDHANIVGFLTLSLKGTPKIGLIAVDVDFQGHGIGRQLLMKTEKYLFENQYPKLEVDTQQANIQACRFYENNGFRIKQRMHVFHFWL